MLIHSSKNIFEIAEILNFLLSDIHFLNFFEKLKVEMRTHAIWFP